MLPSRALNDVFIGESISARVSYFEMNVNSKCNSKHKCSGLVVATGLRMGMNWIYANVFDVFVIGSVKTFPLDTSISHAPPIESLNPAIGHGISFVYLITVSHIKTL